MKDALPTVFSWVERFSRGAIIATIVIFGLLRIAGIQVNLSIQVTIALVGLLIGIPHGAIDHLISIPSTPRGRFYIYIAGYVALAVLAGSIIVKWNLYGFQAVIVMSSLHFGYGDASFRNEWRSAAKAANFPWLIESIYAIPAGFAPVLLPLTDPKSASALGRIRLTLEGWAGSHSDPLRVVTLSVALVSLLVLLISKKFDFAIDLVLLVALALTAPPLVAFATYFGFWHAARHTARLVPKLASSKTLATSGKAGLALRAAITPGLYAVAGTTAMAIGLMAFDRHHFGSGLLWSALVVVWALTVPHMLSTARFDLRATGG